MSKPLPAGKKPGTLTNKKGGSFVEIDPGGRVTEHRCDMPPNTKLPPTTKPDSVWVPTRIIVRG